MIPHTSNEIWTLTRILPTISSALLCPQCKLGSLQNANDNLLVCRECSSEYPMLNPNSSRLVAKVDKRRRPTDGDCLRAKLKEKP